MRWRGDRCRAGGSAGKRRCHRAGEGTHSNAVSHPDSNRNPAAYRYSVANGDTSATANTRTIANT